MKIAMIKFVGLSSVITFIILIGGCQSVFHFFPPPETEEGLWHQPGKNSVDVKKALLECGFANFNAMAPSIDYLAASVCMERLGYVREITSLGEKTPVCTTAWYKNDPSCQPDAVIPTPSIERRLNSQYCQSVYYHDRPECQP
jgi:hypothetical protein